MTKENTMPTTNVLIIDNAAESNSSLNIAISELMYRFKKVPDLKDALQILSANFYPVVLFFISDDSGDNLNTIKALKQEHPETGIIILTVLGNQPLAAEAFNAGAADYLLLPLSGDILHNKIKTICEMQQKNNELLMLRQQLAMSYAFDSFVGLSPEIDRIKRTARQLAQYDLPVILSGPAGTGKNLLARIIHYHSQRRQNPLAEIDCSAIPTENITAELFGSQNRIDGTNLQLSIFERAERGTVFIDHLHELETATQSRLAKQFERHWLNDAAAANSDTVSDFRLIISLNEPIHNLVKKGVIHQEFVESLNAVEITLPTLAARSEDIEVLTGYFLRMIAFENDSPTLSISHSAVEKLKLHHWPGNVRELENCLRRATALCINHCLNDNNISFVTTGTAQTTGGVSSNHSKEIGSMADSQRNLIAQALDANNWNFTHTARQLGIGRTTLWRKVRRFNLRKEEIVGSPNMGVNTNDEQS